MNTRLLWASALFLLIALPPALHAQGGAKVIASGSGFQLEFREAYFRPGYQVHQESRLTAQENGDQLPDGIGPRHVRFTLGPKSPQSMRGAGSWPESDSWVALLPLQDPSVGNFKAAYPSLDQCAEALRGILAAGRVPDTPWNNLPVWDFLDATQMVHAKLRILATPWCRGVEYLTQEIQEPCALSNHRLIFRFVGLSSDGHYLVDVSTHVAAPVLPIPAKGIEDAREAAVRAYCRRAQKILNACADQDYFPPLGTLEELVRSIRPNP
jgi:hypothetical protein